MLQCELLYIAFLPMHFLVSVTHSIIPQLIHIMYMFNCSHCYSDVGQVHTYVYIRQSTCACVITNMLCFWHSKICTKLIASISASLYSNGYS